MSLPVLYQVGGLLIDPPCPWLPPDVGVVAELVIREAHARVGIREHPVGSNRGPQIDAWLRLAKVPESVILGGNGFWCAAWAGAMWRAGGITELPGGYGDCDVLLRWAQQTRRWSPVPTLAAMVLYGKPGPAGHAPDAKHVGIVADLEKPYLSFEANTTVEGSTFERNGTAVAMKLIDAHDPVLGYVHVFPLAP